jgi:hypothetical protein
MSLNSNHVVLNTMLNVIVDVGRLMTLLDLSPADFRRFLTVLVDRRLLGSQCCLSTGLVTNGIPLTKRCNDLSSRSDVTRGLPDLGQKPQCVIILLTFKYLLHSLYGLML